MSSHQIAVTIATVGYTGYLPVAPGSWCSLVFMFIALITTGVADVWFWFCIAACALALPALWAIKTLQPSWGPDPGRIVIDEAIGMCVVYAVPMMTASVWYIVGGFLLFRIFDIAKPVPASTLNNRTEAWAVIADDVIASIYTIVVVYCINFFVQLTPFALKTL